MIQFWRIYFCIYILTFVFPLLVIDTHTIVYVRTISYYCPSIDTVRTVPYHIAFTIIFYSIFINNYKFTYTAVSSLRIQFWVLPYHKYHIQNSLYHTDSFAYLGLAFFDRSDFMFQLSFHGISFFIHFTMFSEFWYFHNLSNYIVRHYTAEKCAIQSTQIQNSILCHKLPTLDIVKFCFWLCPLFCFINLFRML